MSAICTICALPYSRTLLLACILIYIVASYCFWNDLSGLLYLASGSVGVLVSANFSTHVVTAGGSAGSFGLLGKNPVFTKLLL